MILKKITQPFENGLVAYETSMIIEKEIHLDE
jgi:hypothetical protein